MNGTYKLDLPCFPALDFVPDISIFRLIMALVANEANLPCFIAGFDYSVSIFYGGDKRLFAADVGTGFERIVDLVDVLGVGGCDHNRVGLDLFQHLLVVLKGGTVGKVRVSFFGLLDLLRIGVDKRDHFRFFDFSEIAQAVALKASAADDSDGYNIVCHGSGAYRRVTGDV